jgi:hypothetical protein
MPSSKGWVAVFWENSSSVPVAGCSLRLWVGSDCLRCDACAAPTDILKFLLVD